MFKSDQQGATTMKRTALLAVGALAVLAACSSTPPPQEQELGIRGFTNITLTYDGLREKHYTVTVGTCRVKMKWTSGDGWDELEGLNTEVTANDMLKHVAYQHCVPEPSNSPTPPSASPSTPA
jgi:hypothetical protein